MPQLGNIIVETYDGDTDFRDRKLIRDQGSVIFTNPDMLHITILPKEEQWRHFFKYLNFVVVDELHYYTSLLGAHMGYILRRLRRICSALGNNKIQFISCSATTANPLQHFTTLFGVPNHTVKLVDIDGSPSGRKEFICWNTPFRDPGDPASGRGNSMKECARIFSNLILRGVRTIAFTKIRAQCELLVAGIKTELKEMGRPEAGNLVMGYRGGYTAQDRRLIEKQMFEGKLLGIVATTALELGVDIGSLDAVVTWGFPYSIANLRQQSGRAGRRNKDSLSILVGGSFPTDQYFMQNPNEIFSRPNEEAVVELGNLLVAEGHIQCAAYEMPIHPETDKKFFGEDIGMPFAHLCRERLVTLEDNEHVDVPEETRYYHTHPRFRPDPSKFVDIRGMDQDTNIAIVDITNQRNIVLEELEKNRASFTLYDGAIFLHQGQKYLVRDWNPDKSIAKVEKVNVDWTTVQRDFTDIDPIETEESRRLDLISEEKIVSQKTTKGGCSLSVLGNADISVAEQHQAQKSPNFRVYKGTIRITQNVFGFFKVNSANRILDAISVSNPPIIRYGKGTWLDVPSSCLQALGSHNINIAASIHSASHAILSLFPIYVSGLGAGDVRTECKVPKKEMAQRHTQRKRPARLTFYDVYGGEKGAGMSGKAFEFMDFLLINALSRVEYCKCVEGCVECVCDERCKEGNEVKSKVGAIVVMRSLLGWKIDWDNLEEMIGRGEIERGTPVGIETIVLAEKIPVSK